MRNVGVLVASILLVAVQPVAADHVAAEVGVAVPHNGPAPASEPPPTTSAPTSAPPNPPQTTPPPTTQAPEPTSSSTPAQPTPTVPKSPDSAPTSSPPLSGSTTASATDLGQTAPALATTASVATVSASTAGSKPVGSTTYTWGRVNGHGNDTVLTQVLIGSTWSNSQTTTSDPSGNYTLELTYGKHTAGTYTYRVVAHTPTGLVYSAPFRLTRNATITASSAGAKPIGSTTYTWGRVNGHGNDTVLTQVLIGSTWSNSQTTTSDPSGNYTLELTYGKHTAGTYTYRVVAHTPTGLVYSAPFRLTRNATITASSAGAKPIGSTTYTWGRVNGHGNDTVLTQVLIGSTWSNSQTTTSDPSGNYTLELTYGKHTAGTYTYRVVAHTPTGLVYSAPFRFERECVVNRTLTEGHSGADVACFERELLRRGLQTSYIDSYFGSATKLEGTRAAERMFGLSPDGVADPFLLDALGLWAGPLPSGWNQRPGDCGLYRSGKAVLIDKVSQRLWLCENGTAVSGLLPFTSGQSYQAPMGEYSVYFKSNPWWSDGGRYQLDHFTGWTRGVGGGRIGFHKYVIMDEWQVGTEAWRNRSGGCFRMRSADAARIYAWATYGTTVRVLNNG